ncbi:MAG TPA: AurF domain containing protein, partial [Thermoanaerobaculia bacterium]|nr:AurF domain containing protein [Thermoanaerobaculia bacterium]
QDESRHIAFGREIVKELFQRVKERQPAAKLAEIDLYLSRYLVASLQSLYSPAVYGDAGVPEPYKARTRLLADPGRAEQNELVMRRTIDFFTHQGILAERPRLQ